MKEEALKLADEFDEMTDPFQSLAYAHKAQAMIRRLVEENDRIIRDLIGASLYEHDYKTLIEKLKPLSDEEILHIYNESYRNTLMGIDPLVFAREIEERHGIK